MAVMVKDSDSIGTTPVWISVFTTLSDKTYLALSARGQVESRRVLLLFYPCSLIQIQMWRLKKYV